MPNGNSQTTPATTAEPSPTDTPAHHTGRDALGPYRAVQRSEHTPAGADREYDREYDREVRLLDRLRRIRGDESDFPSFVAPMDLVEEVLANPPVVELPDEELDQGDEEPPDLYCSKGLHERTPENLAANGACKSCARITRKRKAGHSVCWTGLHEEPEEGLICECGEPQPASDWLDWVQVESAVAGEKLSRALTNAETVSAIRTIERRWNLTGPYDAADYLQIPRGRARYLLGEWDKGRNTPDATTALLAECEPD